VRRARPVRRSAAPFGVQQEAAVHPRPQPLARSRGPVHLRPSGARNGPDDLLGRGQHAAPRPTPVTMAEVVGRWRPAPRVGRVARARRRARHSAAVHLASAVLVGQHRSWPRPRGQVLVAVEADLGLGGPTSAYMAWTRSLRVAEHQRAPPSPRSTNALRARVHHDPGLPGHLRGCVSCAPSSGTRRFFHAQVAGPARNAEWDTSAFGAVGGDPGHRGAPASRARLRRFVLGADAGDEPAPRSWAWGGPPRTPAADQSDLVDPGEAVV